MYITVLAPLVTFVAVALAAGQPNPFSVPEGFALTAGKPTTLKWTPTTPGTVTLTLREGSSNNLDQGTVIKCKPWPRQLHENRAANSMQPTSQTAALTPTHPQPTPSATPTILSRSNRTATQAR